MKRSEINQIMREGMAFIEEHKVKLPPFAFWTKEDWLSKGPEYDEIRDAMLGWDITDFGSGDFEKVGLLIFTLRNGCGYNGKVYSEKLLIARENQLTPYHFHYNKMEDFINRGGGNIMLKLYGSTKDGALSDEPVNISVDGRNYEAPAGTVVRLTPGESITLKPGQYHEFWGEAGCGKVLIGEVSKINNDNTDNRFLDAKGRFPTIEEDEEPLYYLFSELPKP